MCRSKAIAQFYVHASLTALYFAGLFIVGCESTKKGVGWEGNLSTYFVSLVYKHTLPNEFPIAERKICALMLLFKENIY